MAMRRRNFLGLLGAALAAPMMPAASSAAGAARTTYGAAIAHAQKYPMVSIAGMSKRVGVSTQQAEALLRRMSSEGLIGKLKITAPGRIHAPSKIFTNETYQMIQTAKLQKEHAARMKAHRDMVQAQPEARAGTDLTQMITHLRKICTAQGMTLAPRCAQPVAVLA